MTEQPDSLEKGLSRLEEILSQLQESAVPLEQALKLYEEANRIVNYASETLRDAERKVEILMKDREGKVVLDVNGTPKTRPFP